MKKIKKIILVLILISILLCAIIGWVVYKNRGKIFYGVDEIWQNNIYKPQPELQRVDVRNNYYIVKNCVIKFYLEYINAYNADDGYNIIDEDTKKTIELQEKISAEKMYAMLDKQYKEKNKITSDNILTKLNEINVSEIDITDMYVTEQTINVAVYFIDGKLRNKKTSEISDFSMMVKVDASNETFSIFLQDYIKENYNDVKLGDKLKIDVDEEIEKNEHNTYVYKHITDEEYVEDLFRQYKEEILYNPELIYNKLDEEYKQKKFSSLEDFLAYTKNNVKQNVIMKLDKYQKDKDEIYTRYVCLDQYGECHIFNEKNVMDYTMILDTYTVVIPEFIDTYYGTDPTQKVALNIQKIFEAINDNDYKYVYSKLADGFKEKYFTTLESFEKYAKEKFFDNNEIDYLFYEKESEELYSYTIKIIDRNTKKSKILKIIMSLQETTNFVFSFDIY